MSNNQVQQFHNEEFGTINALMIDGEPYFAAAECAAILGYRTTWHAVHKHCKEIKKLEVPVKNMIRKRNYIPEDDLRNLIIYSKRRFGGRFEKWVFNEVIPTIRAKDCMNDDVLGEDYFTPDLKESLFVPLEKELEKPAELDKFKRLCCDIFFDNENDVSINLSTRDSYLPDAGIDVRIHGLKNQHGAPDKDRDIFGI